MVRGRHDLTVFDKTKPLSPQFENVEVVIEMGGFASARDIPDTSTDVRLWQLLSTGLDHVDTEDLKSRGFTVTYCPGPLSAVALAESAIMLMLMLSRRFNEARQQFDAAIMYALMGEELSSKTLAIVGFGASGQQLALRAKAFGMRVRAVDVRHIDQTIVDEIQPEFLGGPDDLDDLLCECDYLAVHVPLIDETRHLIDARRNCCSKGYRPPAETETANLCIAEIASDILKRSRTGTSLHPRSVCRNDPLLFHVSASFVSLSRTSQHLEIAKPAHLEWPQRSSQVPR